MEDVDAYVRLPKRIQVQAAEADALVDTINKEVADGGDKPIIDPPLDAPLPEPQQPVVQQSAPTEVVKDPRHDDAEYWKQRFQTLQGIYDADVGKVRAKSKEVELSNEQLLDEIAELKRKPLPEINPITEKDREDFGPELVELIERAAEIKVRPLLLENEKLKSEVNELKTNYGSINERQGLSDQDKLFMKMDSMLPDWRQQNVDPGFLAWLGEEDPVYGIPRKMALENAFGRLEADRVVNIFKTYRDVNGVAKPRNSAKELQRQVSPARTNSGNNQPVVNPMDTHQFTHGEIEQFYKDVRAGRYSDEEATAMEASIFRAVNENRIR